MSETPYAETEALVAVMREDDEAAIAIIADMNAPERRALQEFAGALANLASSWCDGCPNPIRGGDQSISIGYLGGPRKRYHEGCRP